MKKISIIALCLVVFSVPSWAGEISSVDQGANAQGLGDGAFGGGYFLANDVQDTNQTQGNNLQPAP